MTKIIIEVKGGVVDPVDAPNGTEIEVRDYDIENYDGNPDTLPKDSEGNPYKKIEFEF